MEFVEIQSISAATSMESITPTLIYPESLLDQFETRVSEFEEPFDGQFMILRAAYQAAAADGRRVVLDGAGGDVVLGDGTYVIRLLRGGHLVRAMTEITGLTHYCESNANAENVFKHVRSAIAPEFIKQLRRERIGRKVDRLIDNSLISRSFAEHVQIDDRVRRNRRTFPETWIHDYAVECCDRIRPNMTGGRERYARIAAMAATEASDPFMDKRVIEFCSRLPPQLRLKGGWPKIILRDIMKNKLPEEIRWARGKHHLGWVFNTTVTNAAIAKGVISIGMLQATLEGYIDTDKMTDAWRLIGNSEELEEIHTAYLLSAWLSKNDTRPVVTD